MAAAACRAIGQACQPVAAATSIVRGTRGPSRLPWRCENPASGVDAPQQMLGSWILEPQCTMIRQYPGLTMLLDATDDAAGAEQEVHATSGDAPDAGASETAGDAPVLAEQQAEPTQDIQSAERSHPGKEMRQRRSPRAPVTAAAMMMRDYEMRLRSLEIQCRELSSQNARLSSELTAGEVKQQQGRELNLRLSREVQELRRQHAAANAKVIALEEEMATQKDCPSSPRVDVPTLPFLEFVEPPPGLAGPADFDWQNVQAAQREEQEDLEAEGPSFFWGSKEQQMYSPSLLLAHRDLTLMMDVGPPGLGQPAQSGLRTEEVPDVAPRKQWTRPRKPPLQVRQRKRQSKRPPKGLEV